MYNQNTNDGSQPRGPPTEAYIPKHGVLDRLENLLLIAESKIDGGMETRSPPKISKAPAKRQQPQVDSLDALETLVMGGKHREPIKVMHNVDNLFDSYQVAPDVPPSRGKIQTPIPPAKQAFDNAPLEKQGITAQYSERPLSRGGSAALLDP